MEFYVVYEPCMIHNWFLHLHLPPVAQGWPHSALPTRTRVQRREGPRDALSLARMEKATRHGPPIDDL